MGRQKRSLIMFIATVLVTVGLAFLAGAQDATYTTKVYTKQGGEELVIASGGTFHVEAGGTVTLDAGSFCNPESNFDLDDGSGASPSLIFTDETDETATFTKADAGFLDLTTEAGDGLNILVGNLKVGNGTPGVTQDGEDAYVEGTFECDGAVQLDSTLSVAGAITLQNGESINTGTDDVFDLTREDAGIVTLTASDDDATAALTVLPGGAAAMVLGGASTTTLTVTTDGTQDAEVVLPENSIGPDESSTAVYNLILCGELAENGTTFLGPATGPFGGDGSDISQGSAGCDALDNVTEATADAPIFTNTAFKILGGYCKTSGTLGAAETLVYTVRSAAAGLTPALTCTISEAQTDCRILTSSTTDIAAGATIAMQATESSNNADDNGWCSLAIALK